MKQLYKEKKDILQLKSGGTDTKSLAFAAAVSLGNPGAEDSEMDASEESKREEES